MARYTGYLVPSLTGAGLPAVAQVLRDSGYDPGESAGAEAGLCLAVRSLTGDTGEFLEIEQSGGPWDLEFARALSAAVEGFVPAVTYASVPGHYGEALFFCGRTLQARSWNLPQGDIDYGPPRVEAELLGVHVLDSYKRYFAALCDPDRELLVDGRLLASANWGMAPHPVEFRADDETGFSLILLASFRDKFETRSVSDSVVPGWRRRIRYTRGLAFPYVELRGEWPLTRDTVAELSGRLQCTAVGLEVSGGGREFCWAEAYRGALERQGQGNSPADFVRVLSTIGSQIGELPGMLFGFGPGG